VHVARQHTSNNPEKSVVKPLELKNIVSQNSQVNSALLCLNLPLLTQLSIKDLQSKNVKQKWAQL
jgi:hypothetical protein